MTTKFFYCDEATRKVYEVRILPDDRQDPREAERARLIRIHDADRDAHAWYGVPPHRLGYTELQAISRAREALANKDMEIDQQIQDLQAERAEIARLLATAGCPKVTQ